MIPLVVILPCLLLLLLIATNVEGQTTFSIISQGELQQQQMSSSSLLTSAPPTQEDDNGDDDDDDGSSSSLFTGYDDCPCVDLSGMVDAAIQTGFTSRCTLPNSNQQGVLFDGSCFPDSYGSSHCKAHSLLLPECQSGSGSNKPIPSFCYDQWCYVDYSKCRFSSKAFFGTTTLKEIGRNQIYYSYATCNSTNSNWDDFKTTQKFKNKYITVTIPGMFPPGHYKLDTNGTLARPNGPEYYDDSIKWRGLMLDWMDAVAKVNDFSGFNYTFRSHHSDTIHPDSQWTAATLDVQAGLTDMAASNFWVTPERMEMTPFTTPFSIQGLFLWVQQPALKQGFKSSAARAAQPFSATLWMCLGLSILLTSMLVVLFVNEQGSKRKWWRKMHDEQYKHATACERFWIITRILLDSLLQQSTFFFGHTVEYDMYSSMAQKVLMFGFGFLILIIVASYTANLAAFLTISSVGEFVSSMEEASAQKIKICSLRNVKQELLERWPFADFVFTDSGSSIPEYYQLQAYDQGQCQGLVIAEMSGLQNPHLQKLLCERNIVMTDSLVLNKLVAFPAQADVAGAVSYFILQAEKLGITYDKYFNNNRPSPLCPLHLNAGGNQQQQQSDDELMALTPSNMALPFVVFAICAALSVLIHFYSRESRRRNYRKTKQRQIRSSKGERKLHVSVMSEAAPVLGDDYDGAGIPYDDIVDDIDDEGIPYDDRILTMDETHKLSNLDSPVKERATITSSSVTPGNGVVPSPLGPVINSRVSPTTEDDVESPSGLGGSSKITWPSLLDSLADEVVDDEVPVFSGGGPKDRRRSWVPATFQSLSSTANLLGGGGDHRRRRSVCVAQISGREKKKRVSVREPPRDNRGAASPTNTSRRITSIQEILPTLLDGEASQDVDGTMEALQSLQAYQQLMMEGLQEQLRKKQR